MAKRVPFEDPQVLIYVRIAYVATQAVVLAVYYYVAQQVRVPGRLCGSWGAYMGLGCGRSGRRTTRRCSNMVRAALCARVTRCELVLTWRAAVSAVEPNAMVRSSCVAGNMRECWG